MTETNRMEFERELTEDLDIEKRYKCYYVPAVFP